MKIKLEKFKQGKYIAALIFVIIGIIFSILNIFYDYKGYGAIGMILISIANLIPDISIYLKTKERLKNIIFWGVMLIFFISITIFLTIWN